MKFDSIESRQVRCPRGTHLGRRTRRRRWIAGAAASLGAFALASCATLSRLDAVPASLTEQASVPGIPDCRLWLDRDLAPFVQVATQDLARERAALERQGLPVDPMRPIEFLAISGGGDNGAFAAGVLTGWTASGTRPVFRVVTGVSAGALIAPFAYLGPAYDEVVRRVATSIGPGDVFQERNRIAGLLSDGMSSSAPLRRLVEKYVTPELLAQIAKEYATGRALQIATTDLDAGRQVTWNMGAIASSGAPGALELFRNIMIASTSIPGAVSPVMIDVEIAGKKYQEMHVDGGVITQLFVYPSRAVAELERATGKQWNRPIRVYVIRNGRLDPEWIDTPRRTLAIGGRAIAALVQEEGMADVRRTYRIAIQDKADFNLAYIGPDFSAARHTMFDPLYMNGLFDYGYRLARTGAVWQKAPPGEIQPVR
jgi:predicted acylesterase/phospholipase RssA